MKGLTTLSFFAFLYLVIIIIFNETAGEPRGVQDKNVGQSESGAGASQGDAAKSGAKNAPDTSPDHHHQSKFGNATTDPSKKGPKKPRRAGDPVNTSNTNDTNPLADLFQITDPTMRTALGAIYGSYKGNDQCSRKAFCMMGNYMKDMPARDFVFLLMGSYIPPEYKLYYEIFKVAVMYGQNCEVYVCIPDASPPDAASAAARPAAPVPLNPTPATVLQQQQQQNPKKPPQKPQSFDDIFDNSIPR